ncbi:MAG TPA: DUF2173 family protein [Chromatiales bacterium]|nr:DUF2173 family protein [Thiotrichales bacterium]HIP69234.1 DUF2173 family protein [Chromatiales bacterium]
MPDLDTLLTLPGALAAFEISDRGELASHKIAPDSDVDESFLDMLGHVCVANTSIATMQARGWEKLTGMEGFYPISGFTMIGLDWSVVICCNTGVVMDNDNADYQAAYDALQS